MRNSQKCNLFTWVFITFLTSFILGVIFSFQIANNYGSPLWKTLKNGYSFSQNDLDLHRFWEAYELIKKQSYDIDHIDEEKLIDGAISGLVQWLWDKHSEFMTKEEVKKFNEVLSGDFEGIWAVVDKHPLGILIDRVIKWSPALKSWIRNWDIIISANEKKLQDLDLIEAIGFIKWPAGTEVLLEVLREGESDLLKIKVIRDKIVLPSVDSKILEETNYWYIAINIFWEDTADEFSKQLEDLKNTDGLIIDLRENGGWYLISAIEILSNLVEDGKLLVTTKHKNILATESYESNNFGVAYDKPIVVLINENSASASEITAWALHDYKLAILVGTQSYGKWSVQQPFDLENGNSIKLTIAKWFTPKDKNIDAEWITPDIHVDFVKEDFENNFDRQLDTAKKTLSKFIELKDFDKTIEELKKEEL